MWYSINEQYDVNFSDSSASALGRVLTTNMLGVKQHRWDASSHAAFLVASEKINTNICIVSFTNTTL